MNIFSKYKKLQILFSLTTVLMLFLALSAAVLAMRQKNLLHDLERVHAVKELELMGTLAREALIKHDYATVVQFLHSWGMDNTDIVSIDAMAANGYRLALYERMESVSNTFTASIDVLHDDRKLMSIKMVKDLSEVDSRLNGLFMQGAAAFMLFAGAMGAALWYTLHRTAIIPIEEHVREIEELNKGLEDSVEKRTADLVAANDALKNEMKERLKAEDHLRHSKMELERQNKKLKKLDAMKDNFVRDLSHEMKTPVAKHLMQLEMLGGILDGKEAIDSVREILEVMEFGIRRQQSMIGNILLMARIDEGERTLNCLPFRLDSLIEEVVKDYMHPITAYGIELRMDLKPVSLEADRELLWHVFGNIVDNAIKYRNHRDPRLSIRIEEGEGGLLTLFHDNGVGFVGVDRDKAFERFYQSAVSTEGVGLGLNIAKTIVEMLGGSIGIESEGELKGSCVFVNLPEKVTQARKRPSRLQGEG